MGPIPHPMGDQVHRSRGKPLDDQGGLGPMWAGPLGTPPSDWPKWQEREPCFLVSVDSVTHCWKFWNFFFRLHNDDCLVPDGMEIHLLKTYCRERNKQRRIRFLQNSMVLNTSETTSLVGPTGHQIWDQDQPSGWALMGDQGGLVPGGPYCWGPTILCTKGTGAWDPILVSQVTAPYAVTFN